MRKNQRTQQHPACALLTRVPAPCFRRRPIDVSCYYFLRVLTPLPYLLQDIGAPHMAGDKLQLSEKEQDPKSRDRHNARATKTAFYPKTAFTEKCSRATLRMAFGGRGTHALGKYDYDLLCRANVRSVPPGTWLCSTCQPQECLAPSRHAEITAD